MWSSLLMSLSCASDQKTSVIETAAVSGRLGHRGWLGHAAGIARFRFLRFTQAVAQRSEERKGYEKC
jgi:hypothetical protein